MPDFGVLVVGNEQLNAAGLSADHVLLMMQEHQFRPLQQAMHTRPPRPIEYQPRVTMKRLSASLADQASALGQVMATSSRQNDPQAAFLLIYQAVEALIAHVFSTEMASLISDWDKSETSWDMRDRLTEMSNERKRLGLLFGTFVPARGHGDLKDSLNENCKGFLRGCSVAPKEDWASNLYAVRNLIVHRQVDIPYNAYDLLWPVCDTLEDFVFVSLSGYGPRTQ